MASAWGSSWGSAWASSWGQSVAPASADFYQIFHDGQRRRTKDEIRAERERLGILPKAVAKVVRQVAREVVEDHREIEVEDRLREALADAHLAFLEWYVRALRDEIERIEDEEIVLLLLT